MFTSKLPNRMLEESSVQATEEFDLDRLSDEKQFDYGLLNTEARIVAKQRASEIKSLMQRSSQNITEIGQKLIEVKKQLEHGQFENWLKAEFDWSKAAARNFMQVARQFKTLNFSVLDIAPSALYELAAPSTPELARQEIIERAKQGEKITYTKAKSIFAHYKPSKPKEAKQVTADTPVETLDCESFTESVTVKPVKTRSLHSLTQASSISPTKPALIEEAEVEPTRYATPPQNLATVGDVPEVKTDQDAQELAEDQELGQPIEGEPASMHVASFALLQQSAQVEESHLGEDAEEQSFEIVVQPVETVEVQVVEVAEIVLKPAIKPTQEKNHGEHQTASMPLYNEPAVVAESASVEAVVALDELDQELANVSALSSDSSIPKQEDTNECPRSACFQVYSIISSEALEYVSESSNLKFSEFDEVARAFTLSIEFDEIVERIEQEECEEVFKAIIHRIPPTKVVEFFSVEQLNALSQVIASRTNS